MNLIFHRCSLIFLLGPVGPMKDDVADRLVIVKSKNSTEMDWAVATECLKQICWFNNRLEFYDPTGRHESDSSVKIYKRSNNMVPPKSHYFCVLSVHAFS